MLTYYGQAGKRAKADARKLNKRARKFRYSVMTARKGGALTPGVYLVKTRIA